MTAERRRRLPSARFPSSISTLCADLTAFQILAIALVVASLARIATFGDPLIQIDEQFYLLVGDRMLHGALPYVDIWDRKPIGLFLLFAAFRSLGGAGVWQYQIAALLFVSATAVPLFLMARRVAGPTAALASALLYILTLDCAGGEGGQAPIWYNLLVATAIAILFFARSWPSTATGNFRSAGMAIMALFGAALQIKYSVLFEGVFAGIALLSLGWRRGRPLPSLLLDATSWILLALAPTLLAAGYYAADGHFHAWLFANFISILERGAELSAVVRGRVIHMAHLMLPLVLAVPLRRWLGATPSDPLVREDLRLLDAWAASALLGVVLFGTWYDHYALPLLAPFAVVAAPLGARPAGRIALAIMLIAAAVWGRIEIDRDIAALGNAALLDRMTLAAKDDRSCLFVYDGPVALYRTTQSCLATNHIFPSHLQALNEIGATGIDEVAEVRSIMARRPSRVVTMEPTYAEENPGTRATLYAALGKDYDLVGRYGSGRRAYVLYRLRIAGRRGTATR